MEGYKRQAGKDTLMFTNSIAAEQSKLQQIEAEKAALLIGNQDKTEQLLKTTSEHGTILMSIRSICNKISAKEGQEGKERYFVWHKLPQSRDSGDGKDQETVYTPKDCLEQLDVIKEYITGFDAFMQKLNEPYDPDAARTLGNNKKKVTLYQKML